MIIHIWILIQRDLTSRFKKGGIRMVDTTVTGSDTGTSKKPKFSVHELWEHTIMPQLDTLVGEGGDLEGYKLITSGDRAGAHGGCVRSKETEFEKWAKAAHEERGGLWSPQASHISLHNINN